MRLVIVVALITDPYQIEELPDARLAYAKRKEAETIPVTTAKEAVALKMWKANGAVAQIAQPKGAVARIAKAKGATAAKMSIAKEAVSKFTYDHPEISALGTIAVLITPILVPLEVKGP